MGKFSFKKSGGDDDDSSNRSALFGSRSKNSKSPQPSAASNNPYANLPSRSDAYTAAKAKAGVPGYAQQGGYAHQGGNAGPTPQNGAGGGPQTGYPQEKKSGYGANPYGASGGYGGDRYGSPAGGQPSGGSRLGPGGYGGLGPAPSASSERDDNRDALFGGARDRAAARPAPSNYGAPPPYEEGDSHGANPSADPYGDPYGGVDQTRYADRQLTAEEEEEEEVTATKQQIRSMKQSDVSSTRNALRIAAQAEESGMNTLARIGAQGELIHNTEKNLDLTANHNRQAEDRARELKHLNRSLFAVRVGNPFTSSRRAEQRDLDVLERHQLEREQREATRRIGYDSDQRMQKTFRDISDSQSAAAKGSGKQASLAERAKYQFEADSEDEEMENEIDANLDALGGAASRLNGLARATGKEVEEQNEHLTRINAKSSQVDDQIAMNRARLDRFH